MPTRIKDLGLPSFYGDSHLGLAVAGATDLLVDLQAKLAAGALVGDVDVPAVTFVQGPNHNHFRFYDEDMARFAESFRNVPFLRDHDQKRTASRIGTVILSRYEESSREMVQTLRVRRPDAIQDIAYGLLDRFSIGWDYDDIVDSVTQASWFDSPYWPGERVKLPDGSETVCELFFVNPVGIETSAVNVPAVPGTRLLTQLGQLRDEYRERKPHTFVMSGEGAAVRGGQLIAAAAAGEPVGVESGPVPAPVEGVEVEVAAEADAADQDSSEALASDGEEVFMNKVVEHGEVQGQEEGQEVAVAAAVAAAMPVIEAAASLVVPPAVDPAVGASAVEQMQAYLAVLAESALSQALAASGLSEESQSVVRAQLAGRLPTVTDINAAIAAQQRLEQAIVARLQRDIEVRRAQTPQTAVQGMAPTDGGRLAVVQDEVDRVQGVLDWLMGLDSAATPAPNLRTMRDVYLFLTDDHEWQNRGNWAVKRWGGARLDQTFAGMTTTLPNMIVNALNKVLVGLYQDMDVYRWFEPISSVVPHDGSTQNVQLIMFHEIPTLPTVAEGQPYVESALKDSKEEMMFEKRGMWIGLTLEMIRKNDLLSIREVPKRLMRSAIRTRSATVASIFTQASGLGPLMSDGKRLFHLDHGNLLDDALTADSWTAAREACFKQVDPGSGARLGYRPGFLLLPEELFTTALAIFGYGQAADSVGLPTSGGTAQQQNIYGVDRPKDPRPTIISVPEFTDRTNWAWLVRPGLAPVIQIGYANLPNGGKHPMPEIFTADGATDSLMFTNDTLPIKIRDWYGVGVGTPIGVGASVVADGQ